MGLQSNGWKLISNAKTSKFLFYFLDSFIHNQWRSQSDDIGAVYFTWSRLAEIRRSVKWF